MGIKNTFERLVIARQKQARRYVNGALLNLDDATLNRAGLTRAGLKSEGASVYPF